MRNSSIGRTLPLLSTVRSRIAVAVAAMLIVSMTNAFSIWTLKPVIDEVFMAEGDTVSLSLPVIGTINSLPMVPSGRFGILALLAVLFCLSRIIYGAALYTQRYLMLSAGETVVTGLRKDLYRHIISLSPSFFADRRTGALISGLTADLGLVQHLISTTTADLVRRPIEVVLYIGILFLFEPYLTMVSLLIAPPVVIVASVLGRTLRRRTGAVQAKMADLSSRLHETAYGIRIIQGFTAEEREKERFSREADEYLARSKKTYRAIAAGAPITELITAVGLAGILTYGGHVVIAQELTPGAFFYFMAMLMATYQPVKTIVSAFGDLQRSAAALDRVYEIMDTKSDINDLPGASVLERFEDRIAFEDVSFSYPTGGGVFSVSFELEKGGTLAIVGPSGAGKTTLVNLLPRFIDPQGGRITIDGRDIRGFTLGSLRSKIGLVTQETILFHGSIASNIAYGRPGASPGEISAVAKAAQILDLIESLPRGFETRIGERGVRLSGGERQRLAIARALLADPPILILDEATSALDTEAERKVQAALDRLMEGRTTLVIAHRLSTITRADRIIVLDKGHLVEEGRHEDLLDRGGLYRYLYELQFREV